MASYLLQPDGSNTCCDCPDRTSPCDDCTTTGACCFDDGLCDAPDTMEDCHSFGGTYMGNGTTCDPSPCELCSEAVTFCKCGFTDCDGNGYYLTRTVVDTWEDRWTSGAEEICHTTGTYTHVDGYVVNSIGDCDPTEISCSETAHTKSSGIDGCGVIDDDCTITSCSDPSCTNCFDYGRCISWAGGSGSSSTDDCVGLVRTQTFTTDYTSGSDHATGSRTIVTTLSNEYTTELLIENTLAQLTCDEGCSPVFTLNADETCCTAWCVFDV